MSNNKAPQTGLVYHHRIHNPDKSGALYDSLHSGLEEGFGLKDTLKHQGITSKPTTYGHRSGASWSDGNGDWHTNGVSAFKTSALRKQKRHITTPREYPSPKDGEQVDSMVEDLIWTLNDLVWEDCAIYFTGLDEFEYTQGKAISRANFTLEDGRSLSVDAHSLFYLLNACEPTYMRHTGQRGAPIIFFNVWHPALLHEDIIDSSVALLAPIQAKGTINEPKSPSILQRKGI